MSFVWFLFLSSLNFFIPLAGWFGRPPHSLFSPPPFDNVKRNDHITRSLSGVFQKLEVGGVEALPSPHQPMAARYANEGRDLRVSA